MSYKVQRAKSFVYDIVLQLVKLAPTSIKKKTLLLVRTNNIGDYILWRGVLPYIRTSERFKNYHITLLGNKAWKGLYEAFDSKTVDSTIWVDIVRLKSDMRYRYSLLRDVRKLGSEVVINTIFSRAKRVDDAFVLACTNSHKIGQKSDDTNVFDYEKGYDAGLYDELFVDDNQFEFEWYKSIAFSRFFLRDEALDISLPQLDISAYQSPESLNGRSYFIVFPGTSTPKKMWAGKNFAEVTRYIVERYGWLPVVGGSPSDQPYVDDFLAHYTNNVINMVGKTTLAQFAGLAKGAQMMLSIDTGSVHVAAMVGCKIIVLHNGSHYGRYYPYPVLINPDVYGVFPDEVDKILSATNYKPSQLIEISDIDYNTITPEKVCSKIKEIFPLNP